jgi:hypothetical protein
MLRNGAWIGTANIQPSQLQILLGRLVGMVELSEVVVLLIIIRLCGVQDAATVSWLGLAADFAL